MKFRPLSIRQRFTLWCLVALIAMLGGSATATYFFIRHSWEEALSRQLDNDLVTVQAYLQLMPKGEGCCGHVAGDIPFMAVDAGQVVYHSEGICRTGLIKDNAFVRMNEGVWRSQQGHMLMFRSCPIIIYGRPCTLTVGIDTSAMIENLATLRRILATILLAGGLLGAGGSYILAGKAIEPVRQMAREANAISAENLGQRLSSPNTHDELGQLAEAFNKTLERLHSSFEQMREFIANVSHELRTPLTALRSVGEVSLRGEPSVENYQEAIGSMLEEVQRLSRMVEDLLMLARSEAGTLCRSFHIVDVSENVQNVVGLLRVLAEEKEQTLELSTSVEAASSRADGSVLEMAISNILDNAIRFTPVHGHIRVRVLRNHSTCIEVEDEAPVIPENERSLVFERFYRVRGSQLSQAGGAGLGLAIARWAVEIHGGKIQFVEGAHGNCCRIELPAA